MRIIHAPPQWNLDAQIYTPRGWIRGTFVIPKLRSLVDSLNASSGYVKLTGVTFNSSANRHDFVALRRESIRIIIPDARIGGVESNTSKLTARKRVLCLMNDALLEGDLDVMKGTRVSDLLMQDPQFVVLKNARVVVQRPSDQATRNAPLMVVNGRQLYAVVHPVPGAALEEQEAEEKRIISPMAG
ncbi:MAG TPA: hypothetical protein VM534_02065 [Thermoanaerobaculia bacterium]|nr:hypothetical protein [Thermoanaerobaculia bacterium]